MSDTPDIALRPRTPDEMRAQVHIAVETLRALYYLAQAIGPDNREHLALLRRLANTAPPEDLPRLLSEVRRDVASLIRESGCRLSDPELRRNFASLTSTDEQGWRYIPKYYIDRHWFSNYARVFPRWPYVPIHALVLFDADPLQNSPFALWIAEAVIFNDLQTIWQGAKDILADGLTFRTRAKGTHSKLHTFMRTSATTAYHFLEAYLNGVAYGVFQAFHNSMALSDHDFLAEWDSKRKRTQYVSFDRKLMGYPTTCATYLGITFDLTNDADTQYLRGDGKLLRDGLTHPSPYVNRDTADPGKISRIVQVNPDGIQRLLSATVAYVRKVELGLGRDPTRTVPWLTDL